MGSRIPLTTPAIDFPLVSPQEGIYRPSEWPPSDDIPVIQDADGKVITRWRDSVWVLDLWAKQRMVLNFGDGLVEKTDPIDKPNADLLRKVVGWWLYGPGGIQAARTLLTRFSALRPIFALCAAEGILASNLTRFPLVADKLAGALMPSMAGAILSLLHELYAVREKLGFTLLDEAGIARLAAALPAHQGRQTPYIPPRIWRYQISRLKACLDDFLQHQEQLTNCYCFSLDAYITNYGSLEGAKDSERKGELRPFYWPEGGRADKPGCRFLGPFHETAERFGIADLIYRWLGERAETQLLPLSVDSLSAYLTMVSYVGLAYILNFTLMRSDEAFSLAADCLRVEKDPRFGPIHAIQGKTSKTVTDDEAIWITAPSVETAITTLQAVGKLRRLCASRVPDRTPLYWRTNEPWAGGARAVDEFVHSRLKRYGFVVESYPKLFDPEELRITERDLELARLATPSLPETFTVGSIWPLAWHQLRRTGAVNMQASGMVSDASLQFQLKHVSRAMSLYYGQNHAQIRLEESARTLYIQTMYEVLGRELQQLASDRFVSPHGERRKEEIVRLISPDDLKASVRLAKKGGVACREIILGVCMNKVPCPYGGIESIAHCGGGDAPKPCADVLYDRSKLSQVSKLESVLNERLQSAPADSPLRAALEAQKRSVESYYRATRKHE